MTRRMLGRLLLLSCLTWRVLLLACLRRLSSRALITTSVENIERITEFVAEAAVALDLASANAVARVIGVVLDDLTLCTSVAAVSEPPGYLYAGFVGTTLYDSLAGVSGVLPVLVLVDAVSGGLDAEDQCGFPAERIVYVTPIVSLFSGGTCSGVDDSSMAGTSYTLLSLEPSVVPATPPAGSDGGDPDGGDDSGSLGRPECAAFAFL